MIYNSNIEGDKPHEFFNKDKKGILTRKVSLFRFRFIKLKILHHEELLQFENNRS